MPKLKIKLIVNVEEGVTPDAVEAALTGGDCGDFDALLAEEDGVESIKIKVLAEEAD